MRSFLKAYGFLCGHIQPATTHHCGQVNGMRWMHHAYSNSSSSIFRGFQCDTVCAFSVNEKSCHTITQNGSGAPSARTVALVLRRIVRKTHAKLKTKREPEEETMSERAVGRFNRVSPSPGKGSAIAYTLCPANDPDLITAPSNVLTIPLSAITLSASATSATSAAGMRRNNNNKLNLLCFGLVFA